MSRPPHEWIRDDTFSFPDGSEWIVENTIVSPDKKRVTIELVASDAPPPPPEPVSVPTTEKFETTVPDDWL